LRVYELFVNRCGERDELTVCDNKPSPAIEFTLDLDPKSDSE